MLKPKPKKVMIMKHKFQGKSPGGIFYPDTSKAAKMRKMLGKVVACGDGCALQPGLDVLFSPLAGMELIGSDHFDIDKDGLPSVGFNAGSDERQFCIIDDSEVVAVIDDIDIERIM